MKKLTPSELTTMMVVAEDVYSPQGQLIVRKNSILTYQMIAHIKYYNILEVAIKDKQIAYDTTPTNEGNTYAQKVKSSKEFEQFKTKAIENSHIFKREITRFLNNEDELHTSDLLSVTTDLFPEGRTSFSLLDMLNNMRDFDDSTYMHSISVSVLCRLIGIWSGIEDDDLDILTLAGLFHDIGKLVIPPEILNKPGRLTDEEYEIIKTHTTEGFRLLEDEDLDIRIKNAALMHHERYNGTGYPFSIDGEYIDDFASIVAIADVYEALTADRVYRNGVCPFEVIAMYEATGIREYNPNYIFTFLDRISSTYIGNHVRLSDGTIGKIMMKNDQDLTRPLIKLEDDTYMDLREHLDVYIEALI